MKKSEKWVEYTRLMWHGASLRNTANELEINLRTSFRWRHIFLKKPANIVIPQLTGIIEVDDTLLPESFKGKWTIDRPSKKRGGGHFKRVPILLALDRGGVISHQVLEGNTRKNIQATLAPLLSSGSVLCTDGNLSYIGIAKDLNNVAHKRLISLDNEPVIDGIYHIQTLNNYMKRWKTAVTRFHGVGTEYIENYFIEQHKIHSEQTWLKESL